MRPAKEARARFRFNLIETRFKRNWLDRLNAVAADLVSYRTRFRAIPQTEKDHAMAKGYWIAHVDVRDQDGYKAYVAMLGDIFRKHRGRYLARGGTFESMEGGHRGATGKCRCRAGGAGGL